MMDNVQKVNNCTRIFDQKLDEVAGQRNLHNKELHNYRIYANLMRPSIFKTLKPKKKYLLGNVMRIGKKCTLYNNESLLRIQFYKKTLFSDKLISSYTLTRKKAQKYTTLEFNFTKKNTSLINFY
jgi:hypothetical protein